MLVDFSKFTDSERDEFVRGFNAADDIGVDDWDCSTPWGAPWEWSSPENLDGDTPEEWGEAWFEKNREEIAELKAEQEEEK